MAGHSHHADQVLAVVNEQSSAARSTVAASPLRSLVSYAPQKLGFF